MAITTYYGYSSAFYWQLVIIFLGVLIVKVCVSLWGHSGQEKPPMFGDFEAQRHWMEITFNLPAEKWYVEGPDNDLQYWGLDYPPLTAYHMRINGIIAHHMNSSIVALSKSHGLEDHGVKFFMRASVLAVDVVLFLPAAVAYFVLQQPDARNENKILSCIIVLAGYPGLILIDNGHFQYNNVSLGLFILATLAIVMHHDFIGAFLFCCALNYKQMELYHALPFFAYLLGTCMKADLFIGMAKLIVLSLIVITTFAIIWLPFLEQKTLIAVIQRLFPLKRGLYEDKVANFWCSISVLIKFKDMFSDGDLAATCLVMTSLLLFPSFLYLLKNPSIRNFLYALTNTSLIFFLFSFHVHEKSILLAAIPACFLIKTDTLAVIWFLLISIFSMVPLLMKDGLLIPTVATASLFWIAVDRFFKPTNRVSPQIHTLFTLSMMTAVCIVIATLLIPPPERYPDIFPLLISIYSCGHFILFAVNFHIKQLRLQSHLPRRIEWIFFDNETSESELSDTDNNRVRAPHRGAHSASSVRHRKQQ